MSRRVDPDQPVPLAQVPNDFEAQVISQALNSAGIRAAVTGTHSQLWSTGNPLTPVTVVVRRCERMEALRVLRRLRAEAKGVEIPDNDEPMRAVTAEGHCVVCGYDMAGLEERPLCPECGTNLADESALFVATSAPSMLHSLAMRVLIVLILLAVVIAGIHQYWSGDWGSWLEPNPWSF